MKTARICFASLLILFLAFSGCAVQEPPYIKDGKEYGVTSGLFRDRWWNYYERGFSFAEGGFYQEALEDFQSAIQQRADDQWRARTYGMHFVNYFPHRELGIVHYLNRKYPDAQKELESSLKTAESAKAKYFLNKTRKAILEESGADRLSPDLRISSPSDGTITNKFFIALRGEVEDDYFVSSISVNDMPLSLELSARQVMMDQEVSLERGMNEIRIQASDLTGKITEKVLNIEVDRDGPLIIVEDQEIQDGKVVFSGVLTDRTGVTSLLINGRRIPVAGDKSSAQKRDSDLPDREVEFKQEIDLPEDSRAIVLRAEDRAGNITEGKLDISSGQSGSGKSGSKFERNEYPLLAASLSGADEYALLDSVIRKIVDNVPPVIHFKDLIDFQTVFDEIFYLEGSVSDDSRVSSLIINGASILKRTGQKVFFNYLTNLKEGGNRFIVEATDTYGNRVEKVVAVNRQVPKIRAIGSRMSLSVLPLDSQDEQSVLGDAVYDSLIAAFVNQKRFHLVEREKKKMEELLSELRLSQTELVDPATASKIGKIVAADTILTGSIYETENSLEVLTRLVDTETSRIIEAKDVFHEDKSLLGVKRLMEGLALKYKQSFPLLEGIVLKKEGNAVLIDAGSDKNIKQDMRVILFREGDEIRHPETGRVLGSEPEELGEAKVKKVYEEFSRAEIKKGKSAEIEIRDKIITK